MQVKLRALKEGDLNAVYDIELRCFTVPWSYEGLYKDIVQNDFAVYIGAFEGDTLIGYAGMWIIIDEAHITNVAVIPEQRGQGVGRKLLHGLMDVGAMLGAHSMTLEVRPSNGVALKLYTSEGFEKKGIRKKYYTDNGEDAYIMWLSPIKKDAVAQRRGYKV